MTSLHKIERELDDRAKMAGQLEDLPPQYHEFTNIFSKNVSDSLPPSQTCDHEIKLNVATNTPQMVGYGPLYKQTTEQLEAVKQYIINNLWKGFIILSHTLFVSPILMARNPSSGKLWFCVDYQKVNMIMQKNCYPLPLIDKLMT